MVKFLGNLMLLIKPSACIETTYWPYSAATIYKSWPIKKGTYSILVPTYLS